jgi:hypothetical protein
MGKPTLIQIYEKLTKLNESHYLSDMLKSIDSAYISGVTFQETTNSSSSGLPYASVYAETEWTHIGFDGHKTVSRIYNIDNFSMSIRGFSNDWVNHIIHEDFGEGKRVSTRKIDKYSLRF